MAHAVDLVGLLIATLVPIALVVRWNLWGVALGTLVAWGTMGVTGPLLSILDPNRSAIGEALAILWLYYGWAFALLYCLLIYVLKRVGLRMARGTWNVRQDHAPMKEMRDGIR